MINQAVHEKYRSSKLGRVPSDWQDVKFADMFDERREFTNDTEKYPLYSLTIEEGVTPKTERYERSYLIKKIEDNFKIVRKDDFVYNPMNLRFGSIARHKEENEVCVSGYYNVFKIKNGYSPVFIEHYLKSERMMYLYNSIATGSLKEKQRVHFSQFLELELPMPSVKESEKIADILSTWDKAIELKKNLIEQKKEQKKGLMQRLLTGEVRLPGFEGEWVKVEFGKVMKFPKKKPVDKPEDYYLLTVKLHLKGIEATNKKPNVTSKGRPYFLREPGELLIGRQNFHNGGIGIVPEGMTGYVASNAISSIVAIKGNIKFYYYYMSNKNFFKRVEHLIGGTGQKEISESMLKKLKLVIPPTEKEQDAIVEVLTLLDKEIELLDNELSNLKQQKKGLMQLLLTGKVRVKC